MRRPRENDDEGCWEDERRKAANALSSPRKCVSLSLSPALLERATTSERRAGIAAYSAPKGIKTITLNASVNFRFALNQIRVRSVIRFRGSKSRDAMTHVVPRWDGFVINSRVAVN